MEPDLVQIPAAVTVNSVYPVTTRKCVLPLFSLVTSKLRRFVRLVRDEFQRVHSVTIPYHYPRNTCSLRNSPNVFATSSSPICEGLYWLDSIGDGDFDAFYELTTSDGDWLHLSEFWEDSGGRNPTEAEAIISAKVRRFLFFDNCYRQGPRVKLRFAGYTLTNILHCLPPSHHRLVSLILVAKYSRKGVSDFNDWEENGFRWFSRLASPFREVAILRRMGSKNNFSWVQDEFVHILILVPVCNFLISFIPIWFWKSVQSPVFHFLFQSFQQSISVIRKL